MTAAEKFRTLLKNDARYDPEAYNFIYEALDYTLKHVVSTRACANQHVTGQELLEGIRQYGIDQFGCLAQTVLESWGIQATDDFGEIVFNLVEHDLMGKQDGDKREDFSAIYQFGEAFAVTPIFCYSREKDEWQTSYVLTSDENAPSNALDRRMPEEA